MAYGHRATKLGSLPSTPAGTAASVDTRRAAQRCPGFGDGIDPIQQLGNTGVFGLSNDELHVAGFETDPPYSTMMFWLIS